MDGFRKFAQAVADHAGKPIAFIAAASVVVGWAIVGPFAHFSESWQLFINSTTTIVTFLMVFLIQATQNRDARAVHLKLDELLRVQRRARKSFEDLEDASEEELDALESEFKRVRSLRSRRSEEEQPSGHA